MADKPVTPSTQTQLQSLDPAVAAVRSIDVTEYEPATVFVPVESPGKERSNP